MQRLVLVPLGLGGLQAKDFGAGPVRQLKLSKITSADTDVYSLYIASGGTIIPCVPALTFPNWVKLKGPRPVPTSLRQSVARLAETIRLLLRDLDDLGPRLDAP